MAHVSDRSAQQPPQAADYVVIGAGMAGASVAYWLAAHGRVVLLEREDQPGYHTTGRSAAMYMEAYGSPQVRALTLASRAFFERPPEGFAAHPLVVKRGALMVAAPGQETELRAHVQVLRDLSLSHQCLTPEESCRLVPVLRPSCMVGAVLETDACDLDVHAIHQGFLRGVRSHGGQLVCNSPVQAMNRQHGQWMVHTPAGAWMAPVVINAAGAWANEVGQMAGANPVGLVPYRRTAFTFSPPEGVSITPWPMVYSAGEEWYFKPDAGMLLASPANADATEPQDVQPEELDVALGIHRLQEATTLDIRRLAHTWAGLRSFVADKSLVGGYDDRAEDFFWLVGQGGYGIQTAPAMGEACASLILRQPLPAHLQAHGLSEQLLSPRRLHTG